MLININGGYVNLTEWKNRSVIKYRGLIEHCHKQGCRHCHNLGHSWEIRERNEVKPSSHFTRIISIRYRWTQNYSNHGSGLLAYLALGFSGGRHGSGCFLCSFRLFNLQNYLHRVEKIAIIFLLQFLQQENKEDFSCLDYRADLRFYYRMHILHSTRVKVSIKDTYCRNSDGS